MFRMKGAVVSRWVMENRRVEREYFDEELRRLATEHGFQPAGWSASDISDFHRLVQCARAAYVESDLRNMLVLRIERDGADPSRAQATFSSGRVIDLTFKNPEDHGPVLFGLVTPETEDQR